MIAVFSDVHGNAPALQQALPLWQEAEARICLGDSVGYRRHPAETVELVSQNSDCALLGNHDAAGCGMFDEFLEILPPWLEQTLRDTRELPDHLWEWLASRRPSGAYAGMDLAHGSLRDPLMEFLTLDVASEHFHLQKQRVSLVGHTHLPLALGKGEEIFSWQPTPSNPVLDLQEADQWALNPGALGIGRGVWMELRPKVARWHWLS